MTLRKLTRCVGLLLLLSGSASAATLQSLLPKRLDVVWADGRHGSLPIPPGVEAYVISKTAPEYPYEARRLRITGAGVYELRIAKSGKVSGVVITESAGSSLLDKAATAALKKWVYKPGSFQKVFTPVRWTIAGSDDLMRW